MDEEEGLGLTAEEQDLYLQELQQQAQALQSKNVQLNTAIAHSSFTSQKNPNLIQYQLETIEMLTKIEHFLKSDYITTDEQGSEYWTSQEDDDLVLFNVYGVNSIMLIISNYIDKNTILSFYDEMRINQILADLGDNLANFIFCNYERMGMDTPFKKSRFNLVVINILHSIESAYRRAIGGKEREEINASRILTQSDMIGNNRAFSPTPKRRFNLLNPRTW